MSILVCTAAAAIAGRKVNKLDRIWAGMALFLLLDTRTSVLAVQYTAVDLYAMPGASYLTPSPGGPISGAFSGQVVAGSVLWSANGSPTDLRVAEYFEAHLNGTDGIHQYGDVLHSIADDNVLARRPVVWNGTVASATFLDETGLLPLTRIYGAGGGQFVGAGNTVSRGLAGNAALLWNGLSSKVVDLTPTNLAGFYSCSAYGASGTQQVGSGFTFADGSAYTHALLWSGSAGSAVDLNPANLPENYGSSALATDGQQQVGLVNVQGTTHALLWSGSAGSVVDLNPSGFGGSVASAVANGKQVGYGLSPGGSAPWYALVWSGTADSTVNLHQFLPAEFDQSRAYGIDDAGRVFGVAFNSSDQQWHAIEWVPTAVPEPGALTLAGLGLAGLISVLYKKIATGCSALRKRSCAMILEALSLAAQRQAAGFRVQNCQFEKPARIAVERHERI